MTKDEIKAAYTNLKECYAWRSSTTYEDELLNTLTAAVALIEKMETQQADESPRSLEERVARIEKWIDFWEIIDTGWQALSSTSAKATEDTSTTAEKG